MAIVTVAFGMVGSSTPSSTLDTTSSPFLWKTMFSESAQSPNSLPPRTILEDGTPMVTAPPEILLKASETRKDHIFCSFFGLPPSPGKIFSDLNPIWGKRGEISVKSFSDRCCLIFVPTATMRRWILDVGFWSAGTVTFAISEWSASFTFQSQQLTSAPTWLSLRHVSPQLWSETGLRLIASGVGMALLSSPGRKTFSLPPAMFGTAKTRAVIKLVHPMPSAVEVQDKEGNAVRVEVEYDRLPPLYLVCSCYGHGSHRCPSRHGTAPSPPHMSVPGGSPPQTLFSKSCPNSNGSVPEIRPNSPSSKPINSAQPPNPSTQHQSRPSSPVKSPTHQQFRPSSPLLSPSSRHVIFESGSATSHRRRRSSSSPRLEKSSSLSIIDHDISTTPRYKSISPPRTLCHTKPPSPPTSLLCSQPSSSSLAPISSPSSSPQTDNSPPIISPPPPLMNNVTFVSHPPPPHRPIQSSQLHHHPHSLSDRTINSTSLAYQFQFHQIHTTKLRSPSAQKSKN